MKTDGVAPNVDATSTGDGEQEEGDSTSINSFDADVEGIRRNLEEKLAGAESTVGSNAMSTAVSKGSEDAMVTEAGEIMGAADMGAEMLHNSHHHQQPRLQQ